MMTISTVINLPCILFIVHIGIISIIIREVFTFFGGCISFWNGILHILIINVPVDCAAKTTRPGSANLISGSLCSLLVQYDGSTDQDPRSSVKLYDVLLSLRQLEDDKPNNPAPLPELDYLIYLLMATLHDFNPDAVGL